MCRIFDFGRITGRKLVINCGNTTAYYSNADLYLPQLADDVIYLKLNFIFLTKPDGTGNFEQNNPEHIQAIDDVINNMNWRLLNLQQSASTGCLGYGDNNLPTTKIQVVVNKIWRIDPAWDYLYTGYNPNLPGGINNYGNNMLYPNSSNYYYSYLDNDPAIPSGINIVFANSSYYYNEMVNNQNFSEGWGEGWAISMTSSNFDFTQKLRQFFPDLYNKYYIMKNYIGDNPTHPEYPNTPWSQVYAWFYYGSAGGFLHEIGHNFNLYHQNSCNSNIMNQCGTCPRDYLSNSEISKMHLVASTTSLRQYFTENSFKNTSILSNVDQTWDLNFRIFSNVTVAQNSSLQATCKIIMAPESRIIVKNGSNFTMEGSEINSANNTTWTGIKVEGSGSFMILPDTYIQNNYFYAYADDSPIPVAKSADEQFTPVRQSMIDYNIRKVKDVKIFPNPAGDFIKIQSEDQIKSLSIFDLTGQEINRSNTNFKLINVEKLPSGSYILEFKFKDRVVSKKFIKR